jgi:hypothetical protein
VRESVDVAVLVTADVDAVSVEEVPVLLTVVVANVVLVIVVVLLVIVLVLLVMVAVMSLTLGALTLVTLMLSDANVLLGTACSASCNMVVIDVPFDAAFSNEPTMPPTPSTMLSNMKHLMKKMI